MRLFLLVPFSPHLKIIYRESVNFQTLIFFKLFIIFNCEIPIYQSTDHHISVTAGAWSNLELSVCWIFQVDVKYLPVQTNRLRLLRHSLDVIKKNSEQRLLAARCRRQSVVVVAVPYRKYLFLTYTLAGSSILVLAWRLANDVQPNNVTICAPLICMQRSAR